MENTYDIIVIGAGAAGITAAVYARRNGKTVLILEGESFGGQIANSPRVENLPSIKSISGSDFADKLLDQAVSLGAEVELERVVELTKQSDKTFNVVTDYGVHTAKSVIIAAGVKHRHFNLNKEQDFIGHGISYCALCDGAFYKDEEVVLVGDANTALQYALLLSTYCKKVSIYTLFDHFFADKVLVDAIKDRQNITYMHDVELIELLGEDELSGLVFRKKSDGGTFTVNTPALFVAIGQIPDNKLYSDLVELDKGGYIVADENCATKTEGLYVAGDCRTKAVRQVATAVADGAVAATKACNYLNTL